MRRKVYTPDEILSTGLSLGYVGPQNSQSVVKALEYYEKTYRPQQTVIDLSGMPPDSMFSNCLLDDSGSMEKHVQTVRQAFNVQYLAKLRKYGNAPNILLNTAQLNRPVLHQALPLLAANDIGSEYHADGGTPLFDSTVGLLTQVLDFMTRAASLGKTSRSITLIMSDGDDTGGVFSLSDVKNLIESLNNAPSHMVAAYAVSPEAEKVFRKMGILEKNLITGADFAVKFEVFSQASSSASNGAGTFAQQKNQGLGF
jgi:hypothetical protein